MLVADTSFANDETFVMKNKITKLLLVIKSSSEIV